LRSDGSEFAPDDEASGQLDKTEIEVLTFFPTRLKTAESVEPGVADLDHPTTGRMALGVTSRRKGLSLTGSGRNVSAQAVLLGSATTRGRVVATIQAQVPLFVLGKERHRDDYCCQDIRQFLAVVSVGPTEDHCQRKTFGIRQESSLTARLASVGRVTASGFRLSGSPLFPSGAFTMQPSASCHSHSMPTTSPYSWRSTAHDR